MDRIITPQQIQKSVVKIVYKEKEQGTGFFITPNIILTTYHVFLEEKIEEDKIQLNFNDSEISKCKILSIDEQNDICKSFCSLGDNFFR